MKPVKEEIVEFFKERKNQPIKKTIDELCKRYNIRRLPKKSCHQCLHYHKVQPGEITYTGTFPNIERCSLGHPISEYAADYCKDYWSCTEWKN